MRAVCVRVPSVHVCACARLCVFARVHGSPADDQGCAVCVQVRCGLKLGLQVYLSLGCVCVCVCAVWVEDVQTSASSILSRFDCSRCSATARA